MKVKVDFQTDKLPLAYRLMMVSFIKDCLRKGSEEAYHEYFSTPRPKPYVFSVYLKNFHFGREEIRLSGFQLQIASSDYHFMIPFLNGLQRTPAFQYKEYRVQRGKIQFDRVRPVQSPKIVVRTLSPILVEDEQHRPIAPEEAEYAVQFRTIMNKMSQSLRNCPLKRDLTISPISTKKAVIKESNDTFLKAREEQRTTTEYLYFTAYHGRFLLEGDPQDLQWILETGAGLRTGQGFGHVELEREVNAV